MARTIALIGVPSDHNGNARSSAAGPGALRAAGLVDRLTAAGRAVID